MSLNFYFKDTFLQNYFQILYSLTRNSDIFNFYLLSKDISGFKCSKLNIVLSASAFVIIGTADIFLKRCPKFILTFQIKERDFLSHAKKNLFLHQGFAREEKKFCSLSDLHFLGKKVHSHSRYKLGLICTFHKCNGRDPLTLILHSASWNFFLCIS